MDRDIFFRIPSTVPPVLKKPQQPMVMCAMSARSCTVIVCPGMREVIPLAPEPIANTDGAEKQDCEINAAKRLIGKLRQTHPKLKLIVTGDSLYSKQPFIDTIKAAGMPFILVAKPDDHKIL